MHIYFCFYPFYTTFVPRINYLIYSQLNIFPVLESNHIRHDSCYY
jgi:hypothetical protein